MFRIESIFFFMQKTAYEMRISDWSSDVCSSDLPSASRWAQGFEAMTVPKVALAPHGMTDTAAPRLPHPYLLFLGYTTEPSSAKNAFGRSEKRRDGKACGSMCRSRWSTSHYNKKALHNHSFERYSYTIH